MRRIVLLCSVLACDKPTEQEGPPAKAVESVPTDTVDEDAKWVSAGPVVMEPMVVVLGVYAMPGARGDVEQAARKLYEKKYAYLKKVEKLEDGMPTPGLMIDTPAMADFVPPDLAILEYRGRGLSEEQKQAVQKSPKVVVLAFVADKGSAAKVHRDAIAMVAAIAEQTGGLVWDEETRELFTREAWKQRELADVGEPANLPKHFVIDAYRDGELLRMVSLGLSKFGLPDLVAEDVPSAEADRMMELVNATAISMAKAGSLAREGVIEIDVAALRGKPIEGQPGRVDVRLAIAEHDEGDPPGPLAEIVFPGPRASLHERQAALLDVVAERTEAMVMVDHDHPEVVAATKDAKKELLVLLPRFMAGTPDLESLTVKAPFTTTDGGSEWMWVEVVRWNGKTIEGILQNEPFHVPALKIGAKVEVAPESVFDYMHEKADGTTAGGKVEAVIQKLQQQ